MDVFLIFSLRKIGSNTYWMYESIHESDLAASMAVDKYKQGDKVEIQYRIVKESV
jgi:hypothetical protein